jgi:hypothetical protein
MVSSSGWWAGLHVYVRLYVFSWLHENMLIEHLLNEKIVYFISDFECLILDFHIFWALICII